MANIKPYIDNIATAVYGEEVRGSIIDAITKVNDDNESYIAMKNEVVAAKNHVDQQVTAFDTAVSDAQSSKTALEQATSAANTAKSQLTSATTSANTAKSQLTSATTSANTAKDSLESSASSAVADVNAAITRANTAKTNLDSSNVTATATNQNLQASITSATSAKTALDNSKAAANTTKTQLEQATSAANTAKGSLDSSTQTANTAKSQLQTATANANAAKTDLVTATNNAAAAQDSLESVIDEASDITLSSSAVAALWAMQRTGKLYQTKIPKFAASNTTACTKTLDNAGMVCTASTDTTKGQDDYIESGELLFRWRNCNYIRKADGFAVPVAFEGDASYKTSGAVDVGVCFPTFYYSLLEKDDGYYLTISDSPNSEWQLQPAEPAVRQDGTVSPYFVISKYYSIQASDGKLRSQPGLIRSFQSYQNMMTSYAAKGAGYHGAGTFRQTLQYIWLLIKYAQKSSQKVFAGCTSYNYQYECADKSSTAKTFFTLTAAQAANIEVGSLVSIGYPTSLNGASANIDRGVSSMHALVDRKRVTSKETLESGNVAIHIEGDPSFSTEDRAAISGVAAHVYITTMGGLAGETDAVLGRYDGSAVSNTNGRHPYRIQGVEYANGYWAVASDVVMIKKSDFTIDVYKCMPWAVRKTSEADITTLYTKIGTIPKAPNASGYGNWWCGDSVILGHVLYPYKSGASDATGTGDRIYHGENGTGTREYLQGGGLAQGSNAGCCFVYARYSLSIAYWSIVSAD